MGGWINMFLFKKIVGPLFSLLPLLLGIMILGLIFLWFTRRHRTGKIMVTIGAFLLLLLSYGPIPGILLRPLERKYSPIIPAVINKSGPQNIFSEIKYIVVLGGGHTSDPDIPVASQLSSSSLIRLVEGIRLHRELPGTKLILSGGRGFGPIPEAETLSQVAQALGVIPQEMIVEKVSQDTEAQARIIKEIVGQDKFILVTSASHLPRALVLFKKQKMEPVPCPVGHLIKKSPAVTPGISFPSVYNLGESEVALHEYLGIGWARLRGLI
jgi:uncharacterized SAM-binding protein YcdF (DUF218 family)